MNGSKQSLKPIAAASGGGHSFFLRELAAALVCFVLALVAGSMLAPSSDKIWSAGTVTLYEDGQLYPEHSFSTELSQTIDVARIDKNNQVFWLKADIDLAPSRSRGQPLALYLSGLFSAEVFWDGEPIGAKGEPGASKAVEVPGPIDAVIYIPDYLAGGKNHVLTLRISSFYAGYAADQMIHQIALGGFRSDPRRELRYYAPILLIAGLLVILSFQFFRIGYDAGAKAPLALGLFSLGLLMQLLAEISRAYLNYEYDWHVFRSFIMWAGAFLAGTSLLAFLYLRTRWRFLKIAGAIIVLAALYYLWARDGYDSKIIAALQVFALGPVAALVWQIRNRRYDSAIFASALMVIAWLAGIAISPVVFLDRGYYLVSAVFLVLTWVWIWKGTLAPETVAPAETRGNYFLPKTGGKTERVPLKHVLYLRAAGNYCELMCRGGRTILHHLRLGDVMAGGPSGFLRVHKTYAVNLDAVVKVNSKPGSRYTVTLTDGNTIPVSRYRIADLRNALSETDVLKTGN